MSLINKSRKGFSLVELAIALVIIAVMVTAVIGGRRLIQGAKVNALIKDIEAYQAAVTRFYEKYKELPGDMTDADDYWSSCETTCGGCNGNGDKTIDYGAGEGISGWQHIELAGFINLGMTGDCDGNETALVGENVPSSPYSGGGYYLDMPDPNFGNVIGFGLQQALGVNDGPILTPSEAYSVDKKIDDADPEDKDGKVIVGVATSGCIDSGKYDHSVDTQECDLWFALEAIGVDYND